MSLWATAPPAAPYFDSGLNAWVLTRYRDVAAALREPRLAPALAGSTAPASPINSAYHADFRTQALHALSPTAIQQWEQRFESSADLLAAALPTGEPVDLLERYARPWSLQVAGIAANVPSEQCSRLAAVGRAVFDTGAEPYDPALATAALQAVRELTSFFRGTPQWTLQMFVALAHSLPAFLGNAWCALLDQPAEIADLPKAIDELLRFAGPAKAQFRQAVAAVTLGDCVIERNQHVILRVDIANRDPDEFSDPDELRYDRGSTGHLALGTGVHACVGSALVKSAATMATKALLDRFHFEPPHAAVPVDAFAMRYLSSLTVTLSSRVPDFDVETLA